MDYPEAITNVKALFGEDHYIIKIIELCHLVPDEEWRRWHDGLGNSLNIYENKSIVVNKNWSGKFSIIKDIRFKSPVDVISKNSKLAMIAFAEDIKKSEDIIVAWFLGNDNKLRLCIFIKDIWIENQPPLISGTPVLRTIIQNIDAGCICLPLSTKMPISCKVTNLWLGKWPPNNKFKIDMLLSNQNLARELMMANHIKV